MSPTQLTLAQLRKDGYTASVVERWNQYAGIRQDLFGGIDVLACRPAAVLFSGGVGDGEILGVQACIGGNGDHAARKAKLLREPRIAVWIASGGHVEVWSWQTRRSEERTKAGKRSKRLVHHLRREEIRLSDFVPQEQTREALP